LEVKELAWMANAAEFDPALIATEEGRVSRLLLVESSAVTPPAGALLLSVSVHVLAAEGESAAGLQTSEEMTVGETRAMVAVAEPPL